jgi:IS5 family transposase
MHRSFKQLGFIDRMVGPGKSRSDEFFRAVDRVVDWKPIEERLNVIYSSRMGAPSFSPILMYKALLIQRWYNLSDPELEDALNDRKSFARFVGLPLDRAGPDHSTVSRFRTQLIKQGLMEPLLAALRDQIEAAGLILKQGTLMDATFVPSAARPPSAPRKAKPQDAKTDNPAAGEATEAREPPPDPFKSGKQSRRDPDARWGKKGKVACFGHKLHLAVDDEHRIIRKHYLTAANVNDCEMGPDLIVPDGGAHYADKGYSSQSMREALAAQGLANGVMRLGTKHYPLRPADRRRNRILTGLRSAVEGVFGEMKTRLGFSRARYLGSIKVQLECDLVVFTFNLKTFTLAR